MKRALSLCFFVLFLLISSVVAKDKSTMPKLVVNARYVMITTYYGENLASPRVPPDDRQAASDVQNAIQDWGRYILVYDRKDADLIILVRKGRIVEAQGGIGIHTGSDRSNPSIGPMANVDAGDPQDMLAVYQATQGVDSPPLWRDRMTGGLNGPTVRLVEELRTKVEAAAKTP
jgi:hypothetical protein